MKGGVNNGYLYTYKTSQGSFVYLSNHFSSCLNLRHSNDKPTYCSNRCNTWVSRNGIQFTRHSLPTLPK